MHFPENATAEECAALVNSHKRSHGAFKCPNEDTEAHIAAGLAPCDGLWQSYHRHRRRGERPCATTLAAHREYIRQVRQNKERGK